MPNIIELNLLENKSIVATMQGYPLANENSYKIIAGEKNATIFKVVSIPNQYADKSFTIEMVNAKGYGIEETPIVNITNYEFSLPVGMAVAGYSYILFRCKYTENGKQVVVPFQPLKVKVWNTIPQWQDYVDKTANVKVVDGYLILTENGNEYNLGYVKGDKGADGKDILSNKELQGVYITIEDLLSGSVPSGVYNINPDNELGVVTNGSPLLLYVIDNTYIMGGQNFICIDVYNNVYVYSMYEQKWNKTTKSFGEIAGTIYEGNKGAQNTADIKNLYAITKANNLFMIESIVDAYDERVTANGANIIDGAYATVKKIVGHTAKCENLVPFPYNIGAGYGNTRTINGITYSFDENGVITINGTANENGSYLEFAKFKVPKGTYTFSGAAPGSALTVSRMRFLGQSGGVNYTVDIHSADPTPNMTLDSDVTYSLLISVEKGVTVNNLKYKPMMNVGTTALPYQRYFTELKPSVFKAIKSIGKNLLPGDSYIFGESYTSKGLTFTRNSDGTVTINGTALSNNVVQASLNNTFKFVPRQTYTLSTSSTEVELAVAYKDMSDGNTKYFGTWGGIKTEYNHWITFTWSEKYELIHIFLHKDVQGDAVLNDVVVYPAICLGSEPCYKQTYTEDSVEYLEQQTHLHEWDYMLPQEGRFVRQTSCLYFDGTTTKFTIDASNSEFYFYLLYIPDVATGRYDVVANNGFDTAYESANGVKGIYMSGAPANRVLIWFNKSKFTEVDVSTLDKLNAYLAKLATDGTPLEVCYRNTSPEESYKTLNKTDYIAHAGGMEIIDDGGTNNALFGAEPTITQEYFELIGGDE